MKSLQNMKVSFDGLRQNMARNFNDLVSDIRDLDRQDIEHLKDSVNFLRSSIGCLLACYDKDQQPDDFNDLSGLELEEL